MGQLSASRIFKGIYGLFSGLDATDETLLKNTMWRETVTGSFTDGGTAGTAQTATAFWVNNTGVPVRAVLVQAVTPVAVTGHAANYATITVAHRTSAGASATTIATFATDTPTTDDFVAFAPKSLPITAGNDIIPVGGVLTLAVAKASSGVAMAAATSQAYVAVQVEPAL